MTEPVFVVPQLASPAELTTGAAERFTGTVRIAPVIEREGGPVISAYEVFFAAGARTVWHVHEGDQWLVGLTGLCLVQISGEPARALPPGHAVRIAAGIRHWHGAGPAGPCSHLGINETLATSWNDAVSEPDYAGAVRDVVGA
ncbi:MAG: cupin domain-containing protein [Acidobacteria bacterium]|nr:cupin domain-containing protein [Acidobacteriota bacterium]